MNDFDKGYMGYHLSGSGGSNHPGGSGSGCCLPPVVIGILFFIGIVSAVMHMMS